MQRACSVKVLCTKVARILRIVVDTGQETSYITCDGFNFCLKWGRLCDCDFSFLPMLLVSSLKDQSKLSKSLLVGGQVANASFQNLHAGI